MPKFYYCKKTIQLAGREIQSENYLGRNSFIPVGFEIEVSDTGVGARVLGDISTVGKD